MQVFIDESGDTGNNFDNASSNYFILAATIFDDEDAAKCSKRIKSLIKELNLPQDFEFHYNHNSTSIHDAFLSEVSDENFVCMTVVFDKRRLDFHDTRFKTKNNFYCYALQLLLREIETTETRVTVTIDQCGNKVLTQKLRKALSDLNNHVYYRVTQKDSRSTELLQLTDYVAGIQSNALKQNRLSDSARKLYHKCRRIFYRDLDKKKAP